MIKSASPTLDRIKVKRTLLSNALGAMLFVGSAKNIQQKSTSIHRNAKPKICTCTKARDVPQHHTSYKPLRCRQKTRFDHHHISFPLVLEQRFQLVLRIQRSETHLYKGTGYPTTWHIRIIVSFWLEEMAVKPIFLSKAFGATVPVGSKIARKRIKCYLEFCKNRQPTLLFYQIYNLPVQWSRKSLSGAE